MIRWAETAAKQSKFKFRVGAVVVKSGRILSVGCNSLRYTHHRFPKKHEQSLHAEQSAILKLLTARRFSDLAGATIYVARLNSQDRPALAKPCKFCMALINAVGIRKVFYSENHNT